MSDIITIKDIPKIEGHLTVTVELENEVVKELRVEATEGIRLVEEILKGKSYREIPDIASRMCGVCPVIHKVSSTQAVEKALGIELPEELEYLREILVIGGHLQSHVLHLFFFVLPDFLGYESVLSMLPKYEKDVKKALKMKKLANIITEIIGGRAVHPVTPIVGGFSTLPTKHKLESLLRVAKEFKEEALEAVNLIFSLEMPYFERKTDYLAVSKEGKIPLLEGNVTLLHGSSFPPEMYHDFIKGIRVPYSTARHYLLRNSESSYMVGALARININYKYLSDTAKEFLKTYGLKFPSYSPFMNNVAQALEIIHFIDEAISLVEKLIESQPSKNRVNFEIREGEGVAATEAPRGLLIHHYKINKHGKVEAANIITPTAQNLRNLQEDLKKYVPQILNLPKDKMTLEAEKLVRAYDPCVSCAARFLKIEST